VKLSGIVAAMASLPLRLLVGKKSSCPGMLPASNRTIRAMQEDGSLERIIGTCG
jgi:hypothetical protein